VVSQVVGGHFSVAEFTVPPVSAAGYSLGFVVLFPAARLPRKSEEDDDGKQGSS
jgi:hypothetical protein